MWSDLRQAQTGFAERACELREWKGWEGMGGAGGQRVQAKYAFVRPEVSGVCGAPEATGGVVEDLGLRR